MAFPKQYLFSNWGVTTWISEILNLSPIKFVKYTTINILSQLTKASLALNHTNLQLEETFKPITEPLHELIKENKKQKISKSKAWNETN